MVRGSMTSAEMPSCASSVCRLYSQIHHARHRHDRDILAFAHDASISEGNQILLFGHHALGVIERLMLDQDDGPGIPERAS